jgi:hypothetical protein
MQSQILFFIYNTLINIFLNFGVIPAPPGTLMLNDSTFIETQMVSIENYQQFLNYVQQERGLGMFYHRCEPDTSIRYLGNKYLFTDKYKKSYPILNLTDFQLSEYCKWKTIRVNQMKNIPGKRMNDSIYWITMDREDPRHMIKIEYTLPDSTTNFNKAEKQFDVPEKFRREKSKTIKTAQKNFGRQVYGFRCLAHYRK